MKKEDMEEKLNQDPDNGVNTFILTDEDGNDFEFELLDFVLLLLPALKFLLLWCLPALRSKVRVLLPLRRFFRQSGAPA